MLTLEINTLKAQLNDTDVDCSALRENFERRDSIEEHHEEAESKEPEELEAELDRSIAVLLKVALAGYLDALKQEEKFLRRLRHK